MRREKIYEKDWRYSFLKPIVDWCLNHSYRKMEIRGMENVPTDGALIITANHCNTLMDALVILRTFDNETVFGARADIFNKPLIAKIMEFIRILPMVRQRDGLRNVLKNHETQEAIVETLEHKVRFCMFPEGKHRPAHSLQTLGKGTFRAALAANARFGNEFPVYIIPTGIEYGDYFRYRSTCLVTFGQPINVTEFVRENPVENEVQLIEPLRKMLEERISQLITYIKDDSRLYDKWALTKAVSIAKGKGYGLFGSDLYKDMQSNREITVRIEKACEDKPEDMEKLLDQAADFDKKRRRKGLSIYSFSRKNTPAKVAGKAFAALLGLPYYIFSAIASAPMWVTYKILKKSVRDRAFHNTVAFGVRLALGFLLLCIYAAITFYTMAWPWALAITLLTIPSYSYFFDYNEGMRRFISDIKVLSDKKMREAYGKLMKSADRIIKQ